MKKYTTYLYTNTPVNGKFSQYPDIMGESCVGVSAVDEFKARDDAFRLLAQILDKTELDEYAIRHEIRLFMEKHGYKHTWQTLLSENEY